MFVEMASQLHHKTQSAIRRLAPDRCGCSLVLGLALIWPFGGGGRKVQMMSGAQTPAAHGTVTITKSNNGNTALDLKVQSLAKPSSLNTPENAYVVWIQPPDKQPINEGELRVDKNLNGQIHTETPYKRFKLFITAEQNPEAQTPDGATVLSADIAQH